MKTKIKKIYNYVHDYVGQRMQPLQPVSIKLVIAFTHTVYESFLSCSRSSCAYGMVAQLTYITEV